MLVFGAVVLKSLEDGGVELIINNNHQFLSAKEIPELIDWLHAHKRNMYANRSYAGLAPAPNAIPAPPNGGIWGAPIAEDEQAVDYQEAAPRHHF